MVIFDQLRISDDGKAIYLNAHVNKADLFADTTIEQLYICLGSQVYETLTIDPESNGYIYKKDYDHVKEVNEVIQINDDNLIYNKDSFSKDLFFVYIKCANVPDASCCYTMVGNYVLGVTFDENLLYQQALQYTKELNNDCEISKGFVDMILLWNGFKAAVETEHYIRAIELWEMLFGKDSHGMTAYRTSKPCGCHG